MSSWRRSGGEEVEQDYNPAPFAIAAENATRYGILRKTLDVSKAMDPRAFPVLIESEPEL